MDDVLVDSMRGRSSTWTRIRINLRHIPEELRPPQETPDPDDDPIESGASCVPPISEEAPCDGIVSANFVNVRSKK